MKKHLSLLLSLTLILQMVLCVPFFAAAATVKDPALMASTDAAFYEPYPIKSNATRYTPWLTMYHMQRKVDADKGLRGGEGGQMIMSAAVSPVNPNLVLFGTDMGGLWRSVDGGENWYSITDNINMRAVMGIEFHPTKENLVYCIQGTKGTGLAKSLKNTKMDGLYRSKDGGRTWEQVLHALFLTNGASQELIKFDSSGNVYVLSREGVYKSADDGESFTLIGTPDASTNVDDNENFEDTNDSEGNEITVDTSTSGGIFALWVSGDGQTLITATSTSGISFSTNGGRTWTTKNVSTNTTGAYSIAVDPKDETHWYAVFTGESSRLYESKNSGNSWSPINTYYYADKNTPMVVKVSYTGSNTLRLHLVYTNAAHQYRYSDNNGKNWYSPDKIEDVNADTFTKSTGYNTEALEICSSNPDIVFFSYGDVMYKSTNGGKTFFWSNAGYSGNYANGFVFDSKGRLWIPFTDRALAVTDSAYAKGSYPTATKVIDNATIGAVAIDPANENNIYISKGGWSNQTLYKSTDGGATWAEVKDSDTGAGITYTSACKVIRFHNDYATNGIIYAGRYKSSDFGKTWTKLSYNIWDVSPLDSDILFSASGKNVMLSTDGGATWAAIDTKYDETVFSAPQAIRADRFDKTVCWVTGYGGYVFRCTTAGDCSSYGKGNGLVQFGDATNSFEAIVQNPNNKDHLLVGTNGPDAKTKTTGLYETYDGGKTWHVVKGLPSTRVVKTLEFTPAGDEVLIGTCSQGTMIYDFNKYKQYLDGTLTIDKSDEILLTGDADKYRVRVNKNTISFNDGEAPYLANGEMYIPAKKVMEEAGYTAYLNGNVLNASKEYAAYTIAADTTDATQNGEAFTLSNAPQLKNGVLFAPQSFFSSCMDVEAEYNSDLRRVEIAYTPPAVITYSYGDNTAPKTEYIKTGDSITLEKELTLPGYEISHWQDVNNNTYPIGSQVTITGDTTFTAVWKRSNNAKFLTENEKTYYPSGMVAIKQTYTLNSETAEYEYKYTVDYKNTYASSSVTKMCDNVIDSAGKYGNQKLYTAIKFDLSDINDIKNAKLILQASKIDKAGDLNLYAISWGNWDSTFGKTGVSQGNSASFSDDTGIPKRGDLIASVYTAKNTNTKTDTEIDITKYVIERKNAGDTYVSIYVAHNHKRSTDNFNGGYRLYNMYASDTYKPKLIVNELEEIQSITKSGTIHAQADIEGKTAVPMMAFYKQSESGALILQSAAIGEASGETTKKINMDVLFAEGERPVVKFFVLDSLGILVPQIVEQTITN